MTMVLSILLVLVAWTVLSIPLAVLVGRHLGARAAAEAGTGGAEVAARPDLTLA